MNSLDLTNGGGGFRAFDNPYYFPFFVLDSHFFFHFRFVMGDTIRHIDAASRLIGVMILRCPRLLRSISFLLRWLGAWVLHYLKLV